MGKDGIRRTPREVLQEHGISAASGSHPSEIIALDRPPTNRAPAGPPATFSTSPSGFSDALQSPGGQPDTRLVVDLPPVVIQMADEAVQIGESAQSPAAPFRSRAVDEQTSAAATSADRVTTDGPFRGRALATFANSDVNRDGGGELQNSVSETDDADENVYANEPTQPPEHPGPPASRLGDNEELPPHRMEIKRQTMNLFAMFRRFVGEKTGETNFTNSPDAFTEEWTINPNWIQKMKAQHQARREKVTALNERELTAHPGEPRSIYLTPGALKYDKLEKEFVARDRESPIGQIDVLRARARASLTEPVSIQRSLETEIRKELIDIFNNYAGIRFNGQRDVVNWRDFRGINLRNIAGRSLGEWRERLLAERKLSEELSLGERWQIEETVESEITKGGFKKLRTPSQADRFLNTTLHEIATADDRSVLSPQAQTLSRILTSGGIEGYIEIARLFYGGDMSKTYNNLSALTKEAGIKFPKEWSQFKGTTSELRRAEALLKRGIITDDPESYITITNKYFGGDMSKAYRRINIAAKIFGIPRFTRWKHFRGSTTLFNDTKIMLEEGLIIDSLAGYLETADNYFEGNMDITFGNIFATAEMTAKKPPKTWQQFRGSTTKFRQLEQVTFVPGLEGYIVTADTKFGGDMLKTYLNISAIANMTGRNVPEGWQAFSGSTARFKYLEGKFTRREIAYGIAGLLELADTDFDGNMEKAFRDISAVAQMTGREHPDNWHEFQGSTARFKYLEGKFTKREIADGIAGLLELADTDFRGDLNLTFLSISAIANMTGRNVPEGWHLFIGTTNDYRSQSAWLTSHSEATMEEFRHAFDIKSLSSAKRNYLFIKKNL